MRLGIAWGAMFQSPACISLAIRSAPRLGAARRGEVVDLAGDQLVGGHLAAGGVVDDVLADLRSRRMTAGFVARPVLHLVPVAGEVPGRVDRHGPAAVLDAPERVDLGRQEMPGPPDRVLRRQRPERELGRGEDLLDEPAEAAVELRIAAAGVDEQESALLDVLADVLLGRVRRTRARDGR